MNITGNPPPGGILPVTGANSASVTDVSGTATIKGAVADGSTAVEVVLDTTTTIANASAKLVSVRNNGTEKIGVDANGCPTFFTASPFLKAGNSNTAIQLLGNRSSSGTGTDVILGGQATRTNGKLVDILHNGGTQVSFDFNGKIVPGSVPTVKAAGAAFSGSAALDSSGTVTIATTAVTAVSLIFCNRSLAGGTPGTLYCAATADIVAGTSFIIRSFSSGTTAATTDTSTVQWWIIN